MFKTCIKPPVYFPTVTGSICSFNSQYAGLPLKSCVSQISGYQEGSGTPSPSNVRPLHAFSSASLGKCDNNTAQLWSIDNNFKGDVEFNQLAGLSGVNTQTSANVTFTKNNDNSYTISGTANGRVLTSNVVIDRFYTVTGHKYLFDISESFAPLRLREQNNSLPFISGSTVVNCSEGKNAYFTFDSTVDISGTSFDVSNLYINIFDLTQMFDSTPTIADYIYNLETQTAGAGVAFFKSLYPNDYYPYNAGTKQLVGDTLATFTFGQSIYLGYIDWKRGVVVADRIKVTFDGSLDEQWAQGGTIGNNRRYIMALEHEYKNKANSNSNYLNISLGTAGEWGTYNLVQNSNLVVKDMNGNFASISDFITYLQSNPLQLAYELATPIEMPLGGVNLLAQQGVNNIFADCGDTTLEYLKAGR